MEKTELLEDMKCPICFGIPPAEIFQCKNGHMICKSCSTTLKDCPQCRVKFEGTKIRNRVVENMLDKMKFDCLFKEDGCKKELNRKEIQHHIDICFYGREKLALCKLMGLSCDYHLNSKNLDDSLDHLISSHHFKICNDLNANIQLENVDTKLCRTADKFWTPVVFDQRSAKPRCLYVLLSIYHHEEQAVSWMVIMLNSGKKDKKNLEEENAFAKFKISKENVHYPDNITWMSPVVDIFPAVDVIKHKRYTRLPLTVLSKYSKYGCLDINCVIGDQVGVFKKELISEKKFEKIRIEIMQ